MQPAANPRRVHCSWRCDRGREGYPSYVPTSHPRATERAPGYATPVSAVDEAEESAACARGAAVPSLARKWA